MPGQIFSALIASLKCHYYRGAYIRNTYANNSKALALALPPLQSPTLVLVRIGGAATGVPNLWHFNTYLSGLGLGLERRRKNI